jgi:transcriptional regulator with XRE-family HTH domain
MPRTDETGYRTPAGWSRAGGGREAVEVSTATCRPHPGDVSRRVALLREQLGLTREELALRAGMAPSYVRYLEEYSDTIASGPLLRLAAALRTTAGQLLGAAPGPRPALHDLPPQECWDRLAEHAFGRVALSTPDGPAVLPVSYSLEGRAIVYHACPGLGAPDPAPGTEVAFEIDQMDEALGSGWSVLAVGPAERLTGERGGVSRVRIIPERVTGRILRTD